MSHHSIFYVDYALWKSIAQANSFTIYDRVIETDSRVAWAGARDVVCQTNVRPADAADYLATFTTRTTVVNEDEAIARIIGLGGSASWVGSTFIATAGQDTDDDFKVLTSRKLLESTFVAESTAVFAADYVEFMVIDKDAVVDENATPQNPTVLKKYVTKLYVVGDERRAIKSGQVIDLLAGLYLRTRYHSTGTNAVKVVVDWLFIE